MNTANVPATEATTTPPLVIPPSAGAETELADVDVGEMVGVMELEVDIACDVEDEAIDVVVGSELLVSEELEVEEVDDESVEDVLVGELVDVESMVVVISLLEIGVVTFALSVEELELSDCRVLVCESLDVASEVRAALDFELSAVVAGFAVGVARVDSSFVCVGSALGVTSALTGVREVAGSVSSSS